MDDVEYDLRMAMVSMVNGALMAKGGRSQVNECRGWDICSGPKDAIGDREVLDRVFRF
jgi:hypothetical protein